ncbi:hypothetical protein BT69DRAFT_1283435 [Atractiella rhizophila]|nr:hypothetical protein BT69DRAFT_1283435 [Atractiella rhizophila]
MIITKDKRRAIYESLFKEGVLVAKKDYNLPSHSPELDIPNLQVIKACQSLTSKGYVKTQFNWNYYYYTLTNEGIEYLREWLHLPAEIVPATHKKAVRPQAAVTRPAGAPAGRGERVRDDAGYRRKEEGGPGGEFRPRFQGGVGRGGPRE